jgi:release factor glutamine methyltransferase
VADDGTITWRELHAETARRVGSADEARWICQRAGGFEPSQWRDALTEPATERDVARLDAIVARRLAGEPLQYALGVWAFRHLELLVDRRVLIPRPETEEVVDVALAIARSMRPPIVVADLGTGSGAIALSIATELPLGSVEVWATDVSADALDVARANLAGIGRPGAHVRVTSGAWFAALPAELRGRLDLVVSNPPYVGDDDPDLDESVFAWEPARALFGGPEGLDALRAIITDAPRWLAPGGALVLEIGASQGSAVADLLDRAGLIDVTVQPDLAGLDRIASARLPG